MPFDRFLIAPINTGLQTDVKSWLIMDDAFDFLQNSYVFRGRVRKRIGSVLTGLTPLNSRLRVQIGTTDGAGNLAFTSLPGNFLNVGANFSAGNIQFSVYQVPVVIGNLATLSTDAVAIGTVRLNSVGPNVYQFRITGGQAAIANTAVYWYPGNPVMGITEYESGTVNNHPTYAFDTQFAYVFNNGGNGSWNRSGTAIWHGSNTNYFWATNWQGLAGNPVLFVTNFNATVPAPAATDDPIWYFDGTTWTAASGANAFYFLPNGGAPHTGAFVETSRIIVAFKNRLVLLSTIENDGSGGGGVNTAYVNRARFSFNGSPFAVNAWYEPNQTDNAGGVGAGGGFIDAPTEEQIISAEFIKDRLMVYFERSTWELAYTGNEILPFIWQKLNTELGSQATFSTIPFDKEVLTIGNTGVHACNGSNVIRIDNKIPDEIFEFDTQPTSALRTVGIRDYYTETALWTFVSDLQQSTQTFPNQILLYNYQNNTWAMFDDCFTFFGYLEQKLATTWANSAPTQWQGTGQTWNSDSFQANERQVIAGTPEGFMVLLTPDVYRNAPTMAITNLVYNGDGTVTLTIVNHNLSAIPSEFPNDEDFILIENVVGDASTMLALNGKIFSVEAVTQNTVTIFVPAPLAGTYSGGGTAARVSNIQIRTKQFNPYVGQDKNVYIQRIDFAVSATDHGQITVDYFPSSTNVSMIEGGAITGSIMGNSVLETAPYDANLYPLEQYQTILWHPVYFQTSGEYIQFALYFDLFQMINPQISLENFELQGLMLYAQSTSSRLQ